MSAPSSLADGGRPPESSLLQDGDVSMPSSQAIIEEALKSTARLTLLSICLAWLLCYSSHLLLLNLPIAAALVLCVRWLSLHLDIRGMKDARRSASGKQEPGVSRPVQYRRRNTSTTSSADIAGAEEGDSEGDERSGASGTRGNSSGVRGAVHPDAWREKVHYKVVLFAWEKLCNSLVQQWIYDTWYSHLTADREFPSEVRRVLNVAFSEVCVRAQEIDAKSLLLRDLTELVVRNVELYRLTVAAVGPEHLAQMSIVARERALQREMKAMGHLHAAMCAPDGHYKYLRAVSDGILSHCLPGDPVVRGPLRALLRELFSATVLRPAMMLCTPHWANKTLLMLLPQDNSSDHAAHGAALRAHVDGGAEFDRRAQQSQAAEAATALEVAARRQRRQQKAASQSSTGQQVQQRHHHATSVRASPQQGGPGSSVPPEAPWGQRSTPPCRDPPQGQSHHAHSRSRSYDTKEASSSAAGGWAEQQVAAETSSASASWHAGLEGSGNTRSMPSSTSATSLLGSVGTPCRPGTSDHHCDATSLSASTPPPLYGSSSAPLSSQPSDRALASKSIGSALPAGTSPLAPSLSLQQQALLPPSRVIGPLASGLEVQAWRAAATMGAPAALPGNWVAGPFGNPGGGGRYGFIGYPRATVVAPELNSSAGEREHVVYKIRVADETGEWTVTRRYSHFEALHMRLRERRPYRELGLLLPAKRIFVNNQDMKFVNKRRYELDFYLNDVLRCVELAHCQEVWQFLSAAAEGHEPVVPSPHSATSAATIAAAAAAAAAATASAGVISAPHTHCALPTVTSTGHPIDPSTASSAARDAALAPERPLVSMSMRPTSRQQSVSPVRHRLSETGSCREHGCERAGGTPGGFADVGPVISNGTGGFGSVDVRVQEEGNALSVIMDSMSGFGDRIGDNAKRFGGIMRGALPLLGPSTPSPTSQSAAHGSASATAVSQQHQECAPGNPSAPPSSFLEGTKAAFRSTVTFGPLRGLGKASAPNAPAAATSLPPPQIRGQVGSYPATAPGGDCTGSRAAGPGGGVQGAMAVPQAAKPGAGDDISHTSTSERVRAATPANHVPQAGHDGSGGSSISGSSISLLHGMPQQQPRAPLPPNEHLASAEPAALTGPLGLGFNTASGLGGGGLAGGSGASLGAEDEAFLESAGLSAPLYDLVDVVFRLRSRGFFRRQVVGVARQMFSMVAGDAVDLYLMNLVRTLTSEHAVARALLMVQSVLWPGGVWCTWARQGPAPAPAGPVAPQQCPVSGTAAMAAAAMQTAVDAASSTGHTQVDEQPQHPAPATMHPERYLELGVPPSDAEDVRTRALVALLSRSPPALVRLVGQRTYVQSMQEVFEMVQSSTFVLQLGYDVLDTSLQAVFPELHPLLVRLHREAAPQQPH